MNDKSIISFSFNRNVLMRQFVPTKSPCFAVQSGLIFSTSYSVFVKDFKAGLRDIFGGRSSSYEEELMEAREESVDEIVERATEIGANAVVGLKMDYEMLGTSNSIDGYLFWYCC